MKLVSKKDMLFVAALFLFVIVFSLLTGGDAVELSFETESMNIKASGFNFTIAYQDVANLELSTLPDLGEMDKGTDTASFKCGNWNNVIWGDYHLCVIPANESCIVVTLTDGRTVVFNYKEAENTADAFDIFKSNLAA